MKYLFNFFIVVCYLVAGAYVLGFIVVLAVFFLAGISSTGTPASIPYHTAQDMKRLTGVEFPEIVPVDSSYYDGFNLSSTTIKFVPKKPLETRFVKRLDKACKNDSCCWRKDGQGYHYLIYPERPIDRTQGTHIRQVEMNGEMIDDWDGDFISVKIPLKGDTIVVQEGWCR